MKKQSYEAVGSKSGGEKDTSVILEQLELWLNNVRKLKEMRNV